MEIVWDEPKRISNLETHRLDFSDAKAGFDFRSAVVQPSYAASDGRARFIAVGYLDGALVTLIFSKFGSEALSLISLRRASKRDRLQYEQAKKSESGN